MPPRRSQRSRSNSVASATSTSSTRYSSRISSKPAKPSPSRKRGRSESGDDDKASPVKKAKTTTKTTESKDEKAARLKKSVKERLAKAKALKEAKAAKAALAASAVPATKKAKVFELDMSDTSAKVGGVVLKNQPSAAATYERKGEEKKDVNPYLSTYDEYGEEEEEGGFYDDSFREKRRDRVVGKRFNWVAQGQVVKDAEWRKRKDEEVKKAGYGTGRKIGRDTTGKEKGEVEVDKEEVFGGGGRELDVRSDVVGKYPLAVEWWDMDMLDSDVRGLVEKAEKAREGRVLASKTKKGKVRRVEVDLGKVDKGAGWKNLKTLKLVQHPVPVKPLGWKDKSDVVPTVYLTEKERKRQRRLKRAEKLQEVRDQQALGIIPPPEAKLTLGNFMKVMGDSAVMDPSKMEAAVRKQVQSRLDKHDAENESRKLTKEEKKEKKERKRKEDTTEGVKVAAWWIKDFGHKLLRAKVDLNAQQYNLTGLVVERGLGKGGWIVVVEGGPKGVNKFKRLMDVRIKWRGEGLEESSDEEESDDEEGEGARRSKYNRDNVCRLLWEGGAPQRKFVGFAFKEAKSEGEAKNVLKEYGNLVGQTGEE